MKQNPIVRKVSDFVLPPILLFALYVQFHGDFGPGGGFQAGVIFAAGVILMTLVYGVDRVQQVIREVVVEVCAALGVLLYAGVGVVCMLKGANFLDYNALAHDPHHGQHLGILLVELGVGLTVAAVMIAIFYAFAGGRSKPAG